MTEGLLLGRTLRALSLLLLLTLLAPPDQSGAAPLEKNREELQKLRQTIDETSQTLTESRAQERNLLEELRQVEEERATIRQRIAALNTRLSALKQEMATQQRAISAAEAHIATLQTSLKLRLRALYQSGDTGLLQALFATTSPTALDQDFEYLKRIIRSDRQLLDTFHRSRQELLLALEQQQSLQQQQSALLATQSKDEASLRQTLKRKEALVAQARQQQTTLSALLDDLQQKAANLQALILKLESEKSREYTDFSGLFAKAKGALPWPVSGPLKVGFGTQLHPELGTLYDNHGINIAVDGARPVAAVWGGNVVFASPFKGYDNLVIIDHGDSFYTLYANAARLNVTTGDVVNQGQTVAFAEATGDGSVYFEIRHRGSPVNPLSWLKPR